MDAELKMKWIEALRSGEYKQARLELKNDEGHNEAMQETPIDSVGRTLRDAFSAVDDLVILANREDTKAAVLAERVLIGQLMVRVQLLASFAMINTPGKLKVVGQ